MKGTDRWTKCSATHAVDKIHSDDFLEFSLSTGFFWAHVHKGPCCPQLSCGCLQRYHGFLGWFSGGGSYEQAMRLGTFLRMNTPTLKFSY
uniref:Uncharacterized protein n=1 Tax=Knipowitschia caucasica TaxID=637954 RepID=A0AAV2L2Z8_KNICA